MFPGTVETESLTLTQLCEANVDVFDLYDRFAESQEGVAAVFEYVPQEPYASVKEAQDRLDNAESAWEDDDAAQYAVTTTDGDLAGYAGLFLEWDRRTGKLGTTLARPYWGNGYAGECALALTELAFDRLDLDLVAIGHEDGNERSKLAVEKFVETVGGQYDGVLRNWTPIGDEIADHHRYTVTREQYQRAATRE